MNYRELPENIWSLSGEEFNKAIKLAYSPLNNSSQVNKIPKIAVGGMKSTVKKAFLEDLLEVKNERFIPSQKLKEDLGITKDPERIDMYERNGAITVIITYEKHTEMYTKLKGNQQYEKELFNAEESKEKDFFLYQRLLGNIGAIDPEHDMDFFKRTLQLNFNNPNILRNIAEIFGKKEEYQFSWFDLHKISEKLYEKPVTDYKLSEIFNKNEQIKEWNDIKNLKQIIAITQTSSSNFLFHQPRPPEPVNETARKIVAKK